MSLWAGAAVRDITPRKPLFLVGYPHVPRQSTGVNDPLLAVALYLSDGTRAVMSIALDVLFIAHETAQSCRAQISQRTGVPAGSIMITATHTHSGPVTADILSWRDDPVVPHADPEYMAAFGAAIVEAAVAAKAQACEAELAVTTVRVEGVGGNRLAADGVRDPEVGLIQVRRRADRTPLALQLIYAMHPTVLHEDTTLVSSDFPGYTRQLLASHIPGLAILYHNGPCGNLSPRYHVRGQTFAEAERLGHRLGTAVLAGLGALTDADFRTSLAVAASHAWLTLPPRTFPTVAQAEQELCAARADYQRLQDAGAGHGPVRTAECTVFGAEEVVTLAKAQERGETAAILRRYTPVEVQALRIGDHFLAGFPGECFVEYGLELKRRCPGTFPISLANGELQGYIPTPEATGYESRLSFFQPQAGSLLVDAAARLIGRLR